MPVEPIHYDGVRLTRVMPFAWLVTAVLALATHTLAAAGVPLHQPRTMSLVLVATFTGLLALAGTMQAYNDLRARQHLGACVAFVAAFLVFTAAVMSYGLWCYFC